jgi:hypothetical protein
VGVLRECEINSKDRRESLVECKAEAESGGREREHAGQSQTIRDVEAGRVQQSALLL